MQFRSGLEKEEERKAEHERQNAVREAELAETSQILRRAELKWEKNAFRLDSQLQEVAQVLFCSSTYTRCLS